MIRIRSDLLDSNLEDQVEDPLSIQVESGTYILKHIRVQNVQLQPILDQLTGLVMMPKKISQWGTKTLLEYLACYFPRSFFLFKKKDISIFT